MFSAALSIALTEGPNLFPLGSEMLCVARTFLFELNRSDRTACISCKHTKINYLQFWRSLAASAVLYMPCLLP